ncbi:MAG: anti-sigma factor domain-containing protein [Thermomicrobiales bacterium]
MVTGPIPPEPSDADHVDDATAELLAAAALGALLPDQEAVAQAALTKSPAARGLQAEYRAVVGTFPYAAPLVAPPPALRERVLQSARTSHRRHRPVRVPVWGYAVAACLLMALLTWNIDLQQRISAFRFGSSERIAELFVTPGLEGYTMHAGPTALQAEGRVYLTPDGTRVSVAVTNLMPLPDGATYQLWFDRDGAMPLNMTTFEVSARGIAVLVLSVPPVGGPYIACEITREPQGGSPSPSGPQILASDRWPVPDGSPDQSEEMATPRSA